MKKIGEIVKKTATGLLIATTIGVPAYFIGHKQGINQMQESCYELVQDKVIRAEEEKQQSKKAMFNAMYSFNPVDSSYIFKGRPMKDMDQDIYVQEQREASANYALENVMNLKQDLQDL